MATLSRDASVKGLRMATAERWDADEAVTQLYALHYGSLVRTASFLVRHSGEAEEIVQDSFVAMHRKWRTLRDTDRAVGYLRKTVVNRARSAQRHHQVVDKHLPRQVNATASAEDVAVGAESRSVVMAALHQLPVRQREVLVLRYYSDLSEADIAATLGISRGAVKSHASRGLNSLRTQLEDQS